jgi:hypothetical protein
LVQFCSTSQQNMNSCHIFISVMLKGREET